MFHADLKSVVKKAMSMGLIKGTHDLQIRHKLHFLHAIKYTEVIALTLIIFLFSDKSDSIKLCFLP